MILPDAAGSGGSQPVAFFGLGVVAFHVAATFRTPPGWGLSLSGPPSGAKDGIAPLLAGMVETDWSPYTFTMNWRFTRPGHPVRFEADEPICFLFSIQRSAAERLRARIAPIDEAGGLRTQFEEWSRSRTAFQEAVVRNPPVAPADKWQKLYYRGVDPDSREGVNDHRTRLAVCPFSAHLRENDAVTGDDRNPEVV